MTPNEKGERLELEILGPQKNADETWKNRKNDDLYKHAENFTIIMRKRRLNFYGLPVRMEENRLTKKMHPSQD